MLPLSWYATAPLAFLPVILAYLAFFRTKTDKNPNNHQEDKVPYKFLYVISKILMMPGIVAYIIKDIPYALAFGKDNNYYSIRYLLAIVLFLLIDVILIIIFTIIIKTKQKSFQKLDEIPAKSQSTQSTEIPDNNPDKTETPEEGY